MLKFCPECGSILDGKTKCDCGYDTVTGVREVKEEEQMLHPNGYFQYIDDSSREDKLKEMKETVVKLEDLKKKDIDLGEIVSYSYTSAGGMMGSYYSLDLNFKEKKIEKEYQEWHHGNRIKTIYSIDDESLNKIIKLIKDNNICAWSNIPVYNFYRALDAPSVTTRFHFEKDTVSIDSLANIDDKSRNILKEIDSLIVLDDNNKISEETTIDYGNPPSSGIITGPMLNTTPESKKPDTDEYNEYLHFCPECGSKLYKGIDKCTTCNYVIPDEIKNKNNK